jgi:hypothetical protein
VKKVEVLDVGPQPLQSFLGRIFGQIVKSHDEMGSVVPFGLR